ncbi:MAG TPA: radical SAM protein [Acidimicrobiales bacterium]|nr:radical SAM protein [Acidimicrobiales bacterium]
MRLTLVDNLVLPAERDLQLLDLHPHLGLLSVAAAAIADGHQVAIYDPKRRVRCGELPYDSTLYERVADELLAEASDAIGFTTLGCSFLFVVGVGEVLHRRAPDLPLLLGGPHATMLARAILERYRAFDVVVRHEAEETIGAVLAGLERRDFADVPGVTWRTSLGVRETCGSPRIDDLDGLPQLDYELYPMADLGLDLIRVEAGRGCPFACTFCSTATFFQRRYRLKSPQRLVGEMDAVRDRYAPREFKLDHDLFTAHRRKVEEFCDAVRGHGHRWRVSARVDCVDDKLLESMADAGCVGMYFGIETGSPRMQKISAKRLSLELVDPTLDTCERLGIESTASFITGYPEETEEDQDATLDMLGRCFERPVRTCLPQLHILTPEPGTPLFDQFGPSLEFDGYATPFNAWLLRPEDRDEVRRQPEVFASYHYYPGALERDTHVAVVEAVDRLRQEDPRVLAALIRRHGRSLSALVRRYVASSSPLDAYVRTALGDDDPVTSAVRYRSFATMELEPASVPRVAAIDDGASCTYQIAPNAVLLHGVHMIGEVLAWLDRGEDIDEGALARASYVRWAGDPHIAEVPPAVIGLLDLFGTGRSPTTVAGLLNADPDAVATWVPDLLQAGLLVPVGAHAAANDR